MKYLMFALFFISIQRKLRQHTHLVGHHVIPHANFGGCQRGRYRQRFRYAARRFASRRGITSPEWRWRCQHFGFNAHRKSDRQLNFNKSIRSVGEPSRSQYKKKNARGKTPARQPNRSRSGDPDLRTIDGDRRRQTPCRWRSPDRHRDRSRRSCTIEKQVKIRRS